MTAQTGRQRRLVDRVWDSPAAMTWASFLARSLNLALVLPLVLHKFELAEFNVWQLLSVLMVLGALFDFGFIPTFTRTIAFALGGAVHFGRVPVHAGGAPEIRQTNWNAIAGIVSTIRGVYLRLTVTLFFVGACIGTVALRRPIGDLPVPADGWIAWGITLVGSCIGFWNGAFVSVLQGLNQVALFRRWEAITAIAATLSSAAIVALGGKLIALTLTIQFWIAVGVLRNGWLTRTICSGRIRGFTGCRMDREILAAVWPAAWRSGVGLVISSGMLQLTGLIFSQFGERSRVASYLLAVRLSTLLTQFSQAPFYSRLPELARFRVQGRETDLSRLAETGMRWSYWSFVLPGIAAGLMGPLLLSAIGSQVEFVPPSFWGLLLVGLFFERFGAMHLQLYGTTNDIRWHTASGYTALIYAAALTVLVPRVGYFAFPWSTTISNALFYSWYGARLSYRVLKAAPAAFEARTSVPPFLVLCGYLIMVVATEFWGSR